MRLPELGEQMIELQPLPENHFSDDLPDVGTVSVAEETRVRRQVNCDLSKVSMFRFDRAEYHGDPVDLVRSDPKDRMFESVRLREVNRI